MKSKKLLLGSLSTMALVATPIAAVISCDNDKASTDADKKAAFNAADLIKKIKANDKGVIASTTKGEFYFSEADAKKETSINMLGSTMKFPALTDATGTIKSGTLKVEVTLSDKELAKEKADAKKNTQGDATAKQAAADSVVKVKSYDITIKKVKAEAFVIKKHAIAPALQAIGPILQKILTVTEGQGLYPFVFKAGSKTTNKPTLAIELTDESDAAFKKIFTDLGLQVTALEFEKATADSKEITVKKLTIIKKTTQPVVTPSKQTDLAALKTALGNTITVTRTGSSGTRTTSADLSIKTKGESMTPAQFLAKLKGLIGGTSHIDPITTLVSGKIKDDMVITFSITTAAVAASAQGVTPVVVATPGAAVIKINADSFNEVTVPVTFTI